MILVVSITHRWLSGWWCCRLLWRWGRRGFRSLTSYRRESRQRYGGEEKARSSPPLLRDTDPLLPVYTDCSPSGTARRRFPTFGGDGAWRRRWGYTLPTTIHEVSLKNYASISCTYFSNGSIGRKYRDGFSATKHTFGTIHYMSITQTNHFVVFIGQGPGFDLEEPRQQLEQYGWQLLGGGHNFQCPDQEKTCPEP